jgi:protein ImuB
MPHACIFIPDFPAQAILRAEPEWRDYALVVLDGRAPVQRPAAMNDYARQKGVQLDMPKTLLEQCSSLLLRSRSSSFEMAAHQILLQTGKSFSPRVEELSADTLLLDLAGMDKLFGPPAQLATALAQRLEAAGLTARIAIAANSGAALAAARGKGRITVIPPGREAEVLGPLPLTVLDPPAEILETLDRWGIRDFRALAALPTAALSERLGQAGVRLQALARGHCERPLIGSEPPPEFVEEMELEYPVEDLEALGLVLNDLLGNLLSQLNACSAAIHQIDLYLELQGQGGDRRLQEYEKSLRLPLPTRDPKLLLNLLRLQLEADPPSAPILRIRLKATPASPRVAQGGLFVPPSPDPEKLEIILARIAGLVGQGNVGSPCLLDSHRPESFRMQPFVFASVAGSADLFVRSAALSSSQREEPQTLRNRSALPTSRSSPPDSGGGDALASGGGYPVPVQAGATAALRIYRPPVPASVSLRHDAPERLSFRDVRGRVVMAGGPWRTSGCWWESRAWQYDEWDLEIENAGSGLAGFYRVYLDLNADKWFVRGEYD